MNSLLDAVPYLAAYRPSFVILAILALVVLVQNFLTAPLAFIKNEQTPGMPLKHDHSMLSFRAMRTMPTRPKRSLPSVGPCWWQLSLARLRC